MESIIESRKERRSLQKVTFRKLFHKIFTEAGLYHDKFRNKNLAIDIFCVKKGIESP